METVLRKRMRVPAITIQTTPVWPTEPFQHHKAFEFIAAVKRNDLKAVRNMLMFNSQFLVFQFDDCLQTGLIWAVKRNYMEMSEMLLEKFSRINWRDIGGRTAIHFAVKNDSLPMVKLLLMHHANPGIKADSMSNPIDLCQNKKMLPFLIRGRILKILMPLMVKVKQREQIWRKEGLLHF